MDIELEIDDISEYGIRLQREKGFNFAVALPEDCYNKMDCRYICDNFINFSTI
jgi:hypothetical protein